MCPLGLAPPTWAERFTCRIKPLLQLLPERGDILAQVAHEELRRGIGALCQFLLRLQQARLAIPHTPQTQLAQPLKQGLVLFITPTTATVAITTKSRAKGSDAAGY